MNDNELNKRDKEIDIFDIIFICWNNKFFFILILFICIGIGIAYHFLTTTESRVAKQTSINILIEKNDLFSDDDIVKQINTNVSKALNYERWSKNNLTLSDHFSQERASTLFVENETHTILLNFISKKHREAVISYLSHTVKIISDIISEKMKEKLFIDRDIINADIYLAKNRIKALNKNKRTLSKQINNRLEGERMAYEQELISVENEIRNKTIEINAAEEQLIFIENIDKSKAFLNSPEITLFELKLMSSKKINKSLIENLEKRRLYVKNRLSNLGNTSLGIKTDRIIKENQKLSDLNNKLLDFIKINFSKEDITQSEVELRIHDLNNLIQSNKLLILSSEVQTNQEMVEFENEIDELRLNVDTQLTKLDTQLTKTENKLEEIKNTQIVKLGRISVINLFSTVKVSLPIILIVSFSIGLIAGLLGIFFKEEYKRRSIIKP